MSKRSKQHQDYINKLGARIVKLRKQKKMSQNDLAYEMGWDKPNLRKIEKGVTNPTLTTLLLISEALDVELSELVDIK